MSMADAVAEALGNKAERGHIDKHEGLFDRMMTYYSQTVIPQVQRVVFLQCGDQPIRYEMKQVLHS
jgi:hypothetical protein